MLKCIYENSMTFRQEVVHADYGMEASPSKRQPQSSQTQPQQQQQQQKQPQSSQQSQHSQPQQSTQQPQQQKQQQPNRESHVVEWNDYPVEGSTGGPYMINLVKGVYKGRVRIMKMSGNKV